MQHCDMQVSDKAVSLHASQWYSSVIACKSVIQQCHCVQASDTAVSLHASHPCGSINATRQWWGNNDCCMPVRAKAVPLRATLFWWKFCLSMLPVCLFCLLMKNCKVVKWASWSPTTVKSLTGRLTDRLTDGGTDWLTASQWQGNIPHISQPMIQQHHCVPIR